MQVARPVLRGLRIAHPHKTSNAEAHAVIHIYGLPKPSANYAIDIEYLYIQNPLDIYRCFAFNEDFKSCEVSKHQKQSACKRLFPQKVPTLHSQRDESTR